MNVNPSTIRNRVLSNADVPAKTLGAGYRDAEVLDLCDEVDRLRELLRRHVMDWGDCDTECCPCSHRQALNYLGGAA